MFSSYDRKETPVLTSKLEKKCIIIRTKPKEPINILSMRVLNYSLEELAVPKNGPLYNS